MNRKEEENRNKPQPLWSPTYLLFMLLGWIWISCNTNVTSQSASTELRIICPQKCYEYRPILDQDFETSILFPCSEENESSNRTSHFCRTVRIIDRLADAFPGCLNDNPELLARQHESPFVIKEVKAVSGKCRGITQEEADQIAHQ